MLIFHSLCIAKPLIFVVLPFISLRTYSTVVFKLERTRLLLDVCCKYGFVSQGSAFTLKGSVVGLRRRDRTPNLINVTV